ncbi:MAG TPA: cupin domain-containing protein [Vicinamibacterales bacterium]|nr:cupin domain-containing protein [Vicinamibacterales bacterium]
MSPRARVLRWDAIPLEKATEMVARKTIAGAEIALVQSYLKKGTIVPLHAHAGERLIYVLQGALRAGLGTDDELTVREGEVLVIAANTSHQFEAIDDVFVLTASGSGPAFRRDPPAL